METASLEIRAWGTNGAVVRRLHSAERATVDQTLGHEVNAGTISRAALQAELALGIARFLQQVHTEPALAKGQWKGWRITSLYARRPEVQVRVLRVGDTVERVNGRSIERPEDFKSVWDSLSNSPQLVLDIERDGKPTRLRYTIAD
ncbi:MAG TPA: hypothetical protein VHZ95_15280 [Polyangiales bacterium]|nr:hypothetical protein [Polyangiales bacterium]